MYYPGGFLVAWTPYAIAVFISVFIDENYLSPIMTTLPALFAKTSLMYVILSLRYLLFLTICLII
jgi:hypothetical protein